MATKRKDTLNTKTDVRSSTNPPSLYRIEYPNSQRGMFSLRAPFEDFYTNENQQQIDTRTLTPNVVHPEYLHMDQNQPEQSYIQQSSQRDAEVQCSLIVPKSRDGVFVQRPHTLVTNSYNHGYLSPRYRVQLKLQPTQPNIYEAWNVQTPPRSIPINEPIRRRERSIRVRSPRLVDVQSLSDDESDYDDYLVYTRSPSRTYLPPHVRMVCVRQDANTICY